ncbi:MAG: ATP-binding cassette domain-containing protein [Helicobacter sp.]|uniref:ABC transporter ATP-binding protein n=1 Tax=Helicobacter bilis TaxID=37372 RepID=A0A099V698_9HELI|nr:MULTISPECIES: ATP-binding cassette domain-containing protein [Helicobacter]AQQ60719.1 ABC transporter ATP-binding protein [Helicobacter bilis]MCI7410551.1 ATP-binding cassette domain-containing protein [Helicobacter bilis]MDD7296958.1 ATP-binding cassette domain-containing protein [Helicobacter bilis]MDY4399148.1 ATP-binding cassette domain-containing protein [Helicobacter bilis]MDY5822384.1 ATP-binding cassette domain-containing protein [Helicobacter sp.]
MVEMENVSHKFDVVLYEDISMRLKPMQSMAILGASGSGKSTILNHLSTLLPPQKGQINLAHLKNIYNLNENQLLLLRQKILGIIFQTHYLFRGFNVTQNLQIAELIAQTKIDMQMLEEFGIAHTLKQQIGELSGGQQQRLSIARVLTKKPKILLADEPTGNLDKDTAMSIMQYLLSYVEKNEAALVVATHDQQIAELCTHIVLLEDKTLKQLK